MPLAKKSTQSARLTGVKMSERVSGMDTNSSFIVCAWRVIKDSEQQKRVIRMCFIVNMVI